MQVLLNTSSPAIMIIFTILVVLIIILSKKMQKGIPLIILMFLILCLLIYHSIYLESLTSNQANLIIQTYHCIAVDFSLLLISFISFLWIDSIIAKDKKIKNYNDKLSWFWK